MSITVLQAALVLLLVLGLVPLIFGGAFRLQNIIDRYMAGFAMVQSLFFFVYFLTAVTGRDMVFMTRLYVGFLIVLSGLILILRREFFTKSWRGLRSNRNVSGQGEKKSFPARIASVITKDGLLCFFFALLLIAAQVYRAIAGEPYIYGDDTTYITMVTRMVDTDSLYTVNWSGQYVPGELSDQSYKYLFTSYYPWLAVLCRMTGLHPLILCKTFFAVFVLLLHYVIMFRIGFMFLRKSQSPRRKFSIYVLLYVILIEWGNYSYYTISRRALMWAWNSKSMCFCVLLPILAYFLYMAMEHGTLGAPKISAILVLLLALACDHATLMGLIMSEVLMGVYALVFVGRKKSLSALKLPLPALVFNFILLLIVMYFKGGV